MWVVMLKRRDYLEDIAINGRIEMHLERRVVGCVDCIHLSLSRDEGWFVVITLFKLSMPSISVIPCEMVHSQQKAVVQCDLILSFCLCLQNMSKTFSNRSI
jgi:hypothetical protein